jgi:ferredoxin-fold anticodon binding domain-containing protein
MDYTVTWKPECTNKVFVSTVKYQKDMTLGEIMALAHEYEGLEVEEDEYLSLAGYELYSITRDCVSNEGIA